MQQSAFEAALRLILPGPGDQPLMRILRIAMDVSGCPAGLIGVRYPDRFQIIVSAGIPLSDFRMNLERSNAIAERLRVPTIIEDAAADIDFADHHFVKGAASWRFIASAPVPLGLLPFDVVLNVADSRAARDRSADLLVRLEECAGIAADELRMIGDIASQSESIAIVQATEAMRETGVRQSGLPMALIGKGGAVRLINDRLRAMLRIKSDATELTVSEMFPLDGAVIAARLEDVLENGGAANAIIAHSTDRRRTYLIDLIRVVSADSAQPIALCTVTDRTSTFIRTEHLVESDGESPNVVAEFLSETLVTQKRLLRRGSVPYHALRRWRAPVKDAQVAALKALKRDPSDHFVSIVADELAAAALSLFGNGTLQAVTAVPCGNSGAGCLSIRLAAAVAERLALPHIQAFDDIPRSGGSHPQGNLRRKKMTLQHTIDVPVLLIDDVATSGAHIEEAALLLKANHTPAILPLVWIAAS